MKSCPQCRRTYSDETLSFCLEDGALLSAPYNPQETNAPTFVLNATTLPPTVAAEVPTVVAERAEIPTIVSAPRPPQATENPSVSWKTYLAGLIISIVGEVIFFEFLYRYYYQATEDIWLKIARNFNDSITGTLVANTVLSTPYNLVFYILLSFLLGFIWSQAKWKWGIIAVIPRIALIFYDFFSIDPPLLPIFYVRMFIVTILYFLTACLFAYLGSRLKQKLQPREG